MPGSSGVFCMCYTEAHCRVAALLRSHSGQPDGNFDETSALFLTKFVVLLPPGITHSVALRGGRVRFYFWK